MTTTRRMTYDDLEAMPDDGFLHELVRGEIRRVPPPKEPHGDIEAALVEAINRYLYDRAVALGWDEIQERTARKRLVDRVDEGRHLCDRIRGSLTCRFHPCRRYDSQ